MCRIRKRLKPITLDIPKPLLEINNVTMLEKCIQLIKIWELKNFNKYILFKRSFSKIFKRQKF